MQQKDEELKKSRGAPKHIWNPETAEIIERMSGHGARQRDIEEHVGISDVTMRKYYKDSIRKGRISASTQVRKTLFEMATSGKFPAATIFWLKVQDHWKDTTYIETSTTDKEAIKTKLSEDPIEASREYSKIIQ